MTTPMVMMVMVVVQGLLLGRAARGTWYVGVDFSDASHSLGASLPEHHASVWSDELRILDEPEATRGLVPSPQVLSVH